MMIGYATVKLEGTLSRDPVLRYFPDGTPCASFCVMVRCANGLEKSVTYVECKKIGDGAEDLAEAYRKGSAIHVEGSLRQDRWRWEQDASKGRLVVDAALVWEPAAAARA